MTSWTVAPCILALQHEVNAKYPDRPKQADGTIGDVRHQHETQSDHNPNAQNVVTAWDITTAPFCDDLVKALYESKDRRIKYVIWKRKIWSMARDAEGWRDYTGSDPHTGHIHLSVSAYPSQYNRTDAWNLLGTPTTTKKVSRLATLDKEDLAAIDAIVHKYAVAIVGDAVKDNDPTHVSIADLKRVITGTG